MCAYIFRNIASVKFEPGQAYTYQFRQTKRLNIKFTCTCQKFQALYANISLFQKAVFCNCGASTSAARELTIMFPMPLLEIFLQQSLGGATVFDATYYWEFRRVSKIGDPHNDVVA